MGGWRSGKSNVPVLSEQTTDTDPSASTECNFLTIAFLFAILKIPRARVTVVTIGRPSGIAATANDTREREMLFQATRREIFDLPPIVNISSQDRFCKTPMRQITPIIPKDKKDKFLASSSMFS